MATYKQIQAHIKEKYGYTAKSCWIAHMKEISGLKPKMSVRRYSPDSRVHLCPESKQNDIKETFKYFYQNNIIAPFEWIFTSLTFRHIFNILPLQNVH